MKIGDRMKLLTE